MPRLTYRAHALGPLRAIDWTIPPGVSVIVGPNRVGKSTLLRLPELIRMAHEGNIAEAIAKVFGGSASLRNLTMPASAPLSIGLAYEDDAWSMDLPLRGGALAPYEAETLSHKGQILARRPFGSPVAHVGDLPLRLGQEHLLFVGAEFTATTMASMSVNEEWSLESYKRHLAESPPLGVDVQIANALAHCTGLVWISKRARSYRTYDFEIRHILKYGSPQSADSRLLSTGENVFPLLRNWRDSIADEDRFDFVVESMKELFPHLRRVGFEQAGQTVTMNTSDRRWPSDKTISIDRESTGFITALLQLCAIASGDRGGLVTIDEVETSLHPRAIRVLVEAARRRAASHNLRIVFATQSETVLDQFRDDPSQVFVLEAGQETSPRALTDLFSADYLSQFSLGDLFAHLEFGGDLGDPATAP